MISREVETEILRLYHAEGWRIGTLASQLHVHRETVRRALRSHWTGERANTSCHESGYAIGGIGLGFVQGDRYWSFLVRDRRGGHGLSNPTQRTRFGHAARPLGLSMVATLAIRADTALVQLFSLSRAARIFRSARLRSNCTS